MNQMTDAEIIDARKRGWSIKDIVSEGADEKHVYKVLRGAQMCRDQRPEREYAVTVMVPEIVCVRAQSERLARDNARELFNDNARVVNVEAV